MLRYAEVKEVKWENPLVSKIKYFGLNPTHSVDVLYVKFLNIRLYEIFGIMGHKL